LTEQQCGKWILAAATIFKGSGTISTFQRYFNSMNFAFAGDRPYKAKRTVQLGSQSVYLGFNYRFGSGKKKPFKENKETRMKPKVAVDFIELVLNFVTKKNQVYQLRVLIYKGSLISTI
jgi:hypothetical protein